MFSIFLSNQKCGLEHVVNKLMSFFYYYYQLRQNKQTERTLAGTPQQLWPITAGFSYKL